MHIWYKQNWPQTNIIQKSEAQHVSRHSLVCKRKQKFYPYAEKVVIKRDWSTYDFSKVEIRVYFQPRITEWLKIWADNNNEWVKPNFNFWGRIKV